jgi:hypothetical protein
MDEEVIPARIDGVLNKELMDKWNKRYQEYFLRTRKQIEIEKRREYKEQSKVMKK